MMSDGTIEADDGTIWVTSSTRTQKGTMGALGDQFSDYGKKYGAGGSLTVSPNNPALTGKIALFNDVQLGATVTEQKPGLTIQHADVDCADLIPHTRFTQRGRQSLRRRHAPSASAASHTHGS